MGGRNRRNTYLRCEKYPAWLENTQSSPLHTVHVRDSVFKHTPVMFCTTRRNEIKKK
jgi:hypothetical protein